MGRHYDTGLFFGAIFNNGAIKSGNVAGIDCTSCDKFFVFADNQSRHVVVQLIRFSVGRLFVAGIDFLLTYIMIERYSDLFIRLLRLNTINFQTFPFGLSWSWLHGWVYDSISFNAVIAVFVIQVIAIVVNYFISKFMNIC